MGNMRLVQIGITSLVAFLTVNATVTGFCILLFMIFFFYLDFFFIFPEKTRYVLHEHFEMFCTHKLLYDKIQRNLI